jgi:acetate kinase
MKVLVINCGSSSIKYQLYDAQADQVMAEGIVAKIREEGSYLRHKAKGKEWRFDLPIPSHREGFELIIQSYWMRNMGWFGTSRRCPPLDIEQSMEGIRSLNPL